MPYATHINISGSPGGGKTTSSSLLFERYESMWIPTVSNRPVRVNIDEKKDAEYLFVEWDEFSVMEAKGMFIPNTVHPTPITTYATEPGKGIYKKGILKPEFWPKPSPDTKLMISVFGRFAPLVKKFAPEMINIFLTLKDEKELERRLRERGVDHSYHLRVHKWYKESKIEKDFDYVVYNDGTPEETVRQIEEIAGLTSSGGAMTLPQH